MNGQARHTSDLASDMADKWPEFFLAHCSWMEPAMKSGRNGGAPCPHHNGKSGKAFFVMRDFAKKGGGGCNSCGSFANGVKLYAWIEGISERESAAVIRRWYNDRFGIRPGTGQDKRRQDEQKRREALVAELWKTSLPLADPKAKAGRAYLVRRGLSEHWADRTGHVLRYHPKVEYWHEGKKVCTMGALLARFDNPDGRMVGVHRIYIGPKGEFEQLKLPGERKKMLTTRNSVLAGGCIRLNRNYDHVLGVAEGVETALAVMQATGMPVWAAYSASILPSIVMPAEIAEVVIWADNDAPPHAGYEKACELKQRLWRQGVRARIRLPALEGKDWLDCFRSGWSERENPPS